MSGPDNIHKDVEHALNNRVEQEVSFDLPGNNQKTRVPDQPPRTSIRYTKEDFLGAKSTNVPISEENIHDEFVSSAIVRFMTEHGVNPRANNFRPTIDGKIHRFSTVESKRGDKPGYFQAFYNIRNNTMWINFGDWKTGVKKHKLRIDLEGKISSEKIKQFQFIWNEAQSDYKQYQHHPYLFKKGLNGRKLHGIRIGNYNGEQYLMKAFYKYNVIAGIELITLERDGSTRKRTVPGSKKTGSYTIIGKPKCDINVKGRLGTVDTDIWLAEGYATAYTVHMATGWLAFDAGGAKNLASVAGFIRASCPNATIHIACDRDDNEVGFKESEKIVRYLEHNIVVHIPPEKPGVTDWNDYYCKVGDIDLCKTAIEQNTIEIDIDKSKLPVGYFREKGKIMYKDPQVSKAPSFPVMDDVYLVCELISSDNESNHCKLIDFTIGDREYRRVVYTRDYGSSQPKRTVETFNDVGCRIYNQKLFHELMVTWESERPTGVLLDKTGFIDYEKCDKFYLPNYNLIKSKDSEQEERIYHIDEQRAAMAHFGKKGTLKEWVKNIGRYIPKNKYFVFALGLGVSSMFNPLRPFASNSFGVNFCGDSSLGKTTLLEIIRSLWGDEQFRHNWDTTLTALENLARMHTGTILIMDELSQADPKVVKQSAYSLANREGKSRGTSNAELRQTHVFDSNYASSGEMSMISIWKKGFDEDKIRGGQVMRNIDLSVLNKNGRGIVDNRYRFQTDEQFVDHLKAATTRYYGSAAPEFIQFFVDNVDNIKRLMDWYKNVFLYEYCEKHNLKQKQQKRYIEQLLCIAIAAETFARSGIIPDWSPEDARNAVLSVIDEHLSMKIGEGLMDPNKNIEEQNIVEIAESLIHDQESKFYGHGRSPHGKSYGEIIYVRYDDSPNGFTIVPPIELMNSGDAPDFDRSDVVKLFCVTLTAFDTIFNDRTSRDYVCDVLHKEGYLYVPSNVRSQPESHRKSFVRKLRNTPARVYYLKSPK